MKPIFAVLLTFVITSHNFCYANESVAKPEVITESKNTEDHMKTAIELAERVPSFVQTVVGAGVFVATAPITAILSLFSPPDTFNRTAEFLVLKPARATFDRPIKGFQNSAAEDVTD